MMSRTTWTRLVLSTTVTTGLYLGGAVSVKADPIAIAPNPTYQTLLSGRSGGDIKTADCGFVSRTPNHTIRLDNSIDSMTIGVETDQGRPTLLIDGPDGRFCVQARQNKIAEITGLWPSGTYLIRVGDLEGQRANYTLNINQ
ncbi:hypothetical protein K4A83_22160 [Spirulina subsalsa FACHB-351]|uniref:Uncharacterized protein n=1 Tax=Spirulina subsalsa FACHB-351 TaxID=234711 RepID=A0ABT3LD75_9CYAN|nr:hypothetical protein [Spirulina subsalsa]MCW6038935.1 hypothetical protein [Spirulina subsalsa FACHB-351]